MTCLVGDGSLLEVVLNVPGTTSTYSYWNKDINGVYGKKTSFDTIDRGSEMRYIYQLKYPDIQTARNSDIRIDRVVEDLKC